ncbi:TIGR02302 family protein [Minwuia sp.]|uniref:TIGR02302 family protein n=1 Tax=Minwuia sp. TaxID=2493630 RepID=UPI003A8F44C2
MAQRKPDGTADLLQRKAQSRLWRKRTATRLSISVERLVPLFWPPAALILLIVALSVTGIWTALPGWLHVAVLGALVIAAAGLLVRGIIRFRPASADEATRRLEAYGVDHRPLTAMNDDLALGQRDPAAEALWQAHRRRMAERIEALRVTPPNPDMARRDPYAYRFAAVFLLVLGLAIGSTDPGGNLMAALSPSFDAGKADETVLEAWVTPPAYTGRAPVFITAGATEDPRTIQVPVNSQLLARFHGSGDPVLAFGGNSQPFDRVTDRDLQLETALTGSGLLEIRRGRSVLGAWQIEIVPDTAPTVEITEAPEPTLRGALRIAYHATDDYGLTLIAAQITRLDTDEAVEIELPLPGRRQTKITDVVFRDLTDHPWAGLPVELNLKVRDDADQIGVSAPVAMIMPSRNFTQPAARAVIEQRRKLIQDAEANRSWVVRALEALQINPGTYNDDLSAHLMLSLAKSELRDSGDDATISENERLLWRAALRIEEGQLAVALNKLRDVQERLMEALANGASEEEIQQLMDELQQAMNEYLDSMQQQAMERMQNGEELPNSDQARQVEQRALSDLIDKARELSRSGARDQAREMLSQLQNMLENLQMGTQSQTSQSEQQADQMMDELGRMMEQQQQLMDQTYERQQRSQQPQAQRPSQRDPFASPRRNRFGRSPNTDTQNPSRGGQPGDTADEDLADAQERIRRQLGELMQQLGENMGQIPDELGQAEQSMRDAEGALGQGDRQGAIGSQSDALSQLRRGAESVLEDMANRGQNPGDNNEGASQAGMDGEQTDPLGRTPTESWGDTNGDIVPGEGTLQQSREILDELRKRSGQRHRPPLELDYIERLLKQF